jgi:hypothetical protein
MAYFLETLHINDDHHIMTLCKITREDEECYFARPLIRDNFIRLQDRVNYGKTEQHSHFTDQFETLEIHCEIKKFKENNWGSSCWDFINTKKYNISNIYFIDRDIVKGYNTSLFKINISLYEHMHKINLLSNKNDELEVEVIKEKKKGRSCETELYNILQNTKKLDKMKKSISEIKIID